MYTQHQLAIAAAKRQKAVLARWRKLYIAARIRLRTKDQCEALLLEESAADDEDGESEFDHEDGDFDYDAFIKEHNLDGGKSQETAGGFIRDFKDQMEDLTNAGSC